LNFPTLGDTPPGSFGAWAAPPDAAGCHGPVAQGELIVNAHTGGVSGSACAAGKGMVGVGDRPAPGTRQEDGPGVPVGEAGAGAVVGMGEEGALAGRGAVALGRVARGARGVRGAAVPGRGAARGLRAAGRGDPQVAVRPDVDGVPSGVRGRDRVVRRGREVL